MTEAHTHDWQRLVPYARESAYMCTGCLKIRSWDQMCRCDDVAGDYPWCIVHEYADDKWGE